MDSASRDNPLDGEHTAAVGCFTTSSDCGLWSRSVSCSSQKFFCKIPGKLFSEKLCEMFILAKNPM